MSRKSSFRPSFSPARRWRIGADLLLRTVLMLAVVVMVNYLGSRWFHRYDWSQQKRATLSPRTLSLLRTITNTVNVTLYFDRQAAFYPDIATLLDAYHTANPKIVIRTVDYNRDPGEAERVKAKFKLSGMGARDLIFFESNGRTRIFPGDMLTRYTIERVPDEKEPRFRKRAVSFMGEQMFSSALRMLQSDQPSIAYFLQGHSEGSFTNTDSSGFKELGDTLAQNFVMVRNLDLSGSTNVPADCNLLVILAPRGAIAQEDLQKLDQYLTQGGRMLVLLNYQSVRYPTGLEPVLQRWGVNVLADTVLDPSHSTSEGNVISVRDFGAHPITGPLVNDTLQLILPRPVAKVNWATPPANPPDVTELAFASPAATLSSDRSQPPRNWPLMAAMEQKPPAGLTTARGTARMVVVGDSLFLSNQAIDAGVNRDFLSSAANWLLDRPQWMEGIGPRPVTEFRLQLDQQQKRQLRWLLLGALPGGVLALGWLVWFVRRK